MFVINPAQAHLLVNHVPIFVILLAAILLATGIVKQQQQTQKWALGLLVLAVFPLMMANISGEGAEEMLERLPGISGQLIEQHEHAAKLTGFVSYGLSLLSLIVLGISRFQKTWPKSIVMGILFLVLFALGLFVRTAHLGGLISHPEIRGNSPPGSVEMERHS